MTWATGWCLKGVRWEQLRAGQVITKDVSERKLELNKTDGAGNQ